MYWVFLVHAEKNDHPKLLGFGERSIRVACRLLGV